MSEIESRFVKQGLWVDLGQSSAMGRTITTDTRMGTVIVALLAVLCSLATAHLWFLITFIIHQFRADGRTSDGLFRQQQVTLRALSPPSAVMMEYLRIYWCWRPNHLPKAKVRSFPLPILAALFTCATIFLGVFSSYIVDTTNLQVLASSGLCGPINISDTQIASIQSNYTPIVQSLAVPLAQTCYTDNNTNNALCNIYPRSKVPFQVTRENCPWQSAMCIGQGKMAVSMDSGLLDVRNIFGLNLASKDNVQFRKKTTCAVLSLENRTTLIPATAYGGYFRPPLPEEQFLIYSFGDFGGNSTWNNATFVLSLVTTNVTDRYIARKYVSYMSPEWYYKGVMSPLPEMKRGDADLVLKLVVKNRVAYDVPVNDPLFSAHKETTVVDVEDGSDVTFYYSDVPASVVGCTQQYQFCVREGECTGLGSLPRRLTASDLPSASSLQQAVLELLITSAYNFDISTPQTFQASSLMRVNGYINALPDDQWIQETVGWESNVWASLQISIGDYATGVKARDRSADNYVRKPETEGEKQLCNVHKMRKSGGFVNINVFGLAFIFSFAILFVILDLTLLRFLVYLSRFHRTKWLGPRLERWVQDGVLQLQRRAYQADGQGPWKELDAAVPITTRAIELKDLPLETSSMLLQDPKIWPSTYRTTDATLTTVNEKEIVNVKCESRLP